jgi:predicted O-linked N-acetylglucosamine transferase (SPINDLY family)
MNVKRRSAEQLSAAMDHHRAGRLGEAERLYRAACAADSGNARAFHLLGVVAHQLGHADAAELVGRAVALEPGLAEAHNDRGVILAARGKFAEAAASFERAIALRPDHADARINLGVALHRLGRLDEAVTHFERALAGSPAAVTAHLHLAMTLRQLGRPAAAASHYERALALRPGLVEAHAGLGVVLDELGRRDDALMHCERAVALRPDAAGLRNNLANVLRDLGRLDDALTQYDRALALDPNLAAAHYNRAVALRRVGDIAQARAAFERAAALAPDFLEADLGACIAELPVLYRDADEIAERRAAYAAHLARLAAEVARRGAPAAFADAVGSHQPFYLAYQGRDDRALQETYGEMVCSVMASRYPAAPLPPPAKDDEPIRLGIVSGFFRRHSNWKIPIRGWLRGLDRQRFRVFGYHTGTERDGETDAAAALCERFVQGPLPLHAWRREIIADAPHVLLYPEIGMDAVAAQLGAQRLARVQCVSWGHPVTSGFPTMDYFLTSARMEPPDGAAHYTEKLVRLPNLSVHYDPPDLRPSATDRATLGLRPGATVYWCSQSLPKYLPQYDDVFARIAREAGDCQFVFIAFGGGGHVTEMFRARLDRAFAAAGLAAADHCVILPRLDPDQFVAAVGQCDVVLDSIGWSGCNSTLESLAHDRPIVTLAGPLMRGRHTAAILEMMDMRETIAQSVDDYVAIAIRLGRDAHERAAMSGRVAAGKHRVYRDPQCIAALEAFLVRAARGAELTADGADRMS